MDIILKNVKVYTGRITFECPVCGAVAHVFKGDSNEDDLYFTLLAIYRHNDPKHYGNSRLPSGRCAACGVKE